MGEGTRCSAKHSLAKHSFKYLKYLSVRFSSEPQFPINKVDDESPQGAHLHTCAAYANELGIACYLDKAKFLKSSAVTNRDRKKLCFGEGTNRRLSVSMAQEPPCPRF